MGKQCTHQLLFSADYADVCISIKLCISCIERELGVSCESKVSNNDGGVCPSCAVEANYNQIWY